MSCEYWKVWNLLFFLWLLSWILRNFYFLLVVKACGVSKRFTDVKVFSRWCL